MRVEHRGVWYDAAVDAADGRGLRIRAPCGRQAHPDVHQKFCEVSGREGGHRAVAEYPTAFQYA